MDGFQQRLDREFESKCSFDDGPAVCVDENERQSLERSRECLVWPFCRRERADPLTVSYVRSRLRLADLSRIKGGFDGP